MTEGEDVIHTQTLCRTLSVTADLLFDVFSAFSKKLCCHSFVMMKEACNHPLL